MTGTLYLVSTPIGNLEDITVRALRVLREVTLIAAEDTRRTAKLLHHYQIGTPTTSFHAYNERSKAAVLLDKLESGSSIALVSDAGTPTLSDPGEQLVSEAVARGIRVEAVPGASAILAAIASSGMGAEGFTFAGFPPSKSNDRIRWFAALAAEPRPVVFFEAPHRLLASLADAAATLGPTRPLVAARELTKIHEERVRGTIESVSAHFQGHSPRGEFTLILGPAPAGADAAGDRQAAVTLDAKGAWREFCYLTDNGAARREAIASLARTTGQSSRDIYRLIEQGKALAAGEPDA